MASIPWSFVMRTLISHGTLTFSAARAALMQVLMCYFMGMVVRPGNSLVMEIR